MAGDQGGAVGQGGFVGQGRADDAGRLIGGRYRLARRLGSGGFGSVWQARDETLGVDVAVKEVRLPPAASPDEHRERLLRAQREARHAARLRDHPNVVGVHDVVTDEDGAPWTVMQLVVGRSLEEQVARHGPLAPGDTARVATAVLAALGAAHEAGIVHRDVKPANILLADDGRVLLADFGIAVQYEDTALTATGAFIGSVDYLAPERARGVPSAPAGDLFSLGATLYHAVEGRLPFRRDTPAATLTAVLFEPAPPLVSAGPLAPLINGLLQKDPAERLTAAQAAGLLEGQAPPVPSVPPVPTAPATVRAPRPASARPARSGIRGWAAAAVVAVLALGASAMGLPGLTFVLGDSGSGDGRALSWSTDTVDVLDLADFPAPVQEGGPIAWPWLFTVLATLALLVATAVAAPRRLHPVLRVFGYLFGLTFPVLLIVADVSIEGDLPATSPLPPELMSRFSVSLGTGWWLLHAAAVLALAAFTWLDLRAGAVRDRAAVS